MKNITPEEQSNVISELAKKIRRLESLPAFRNPKNFKPCPDEFFANIGAVDSKCPICDAWEYTSNWPIGVHCLNMCMYPKWFVDHFNNEIMEVHFEIAQRKRDLETMEEIL